MLLFRCGEIGPCTRTSENSGWSKIVRSIICEMASVLGTSLRQHRQARAALCAGTTWASKTVTLVEQGVHKDLVPSTICHFYLAAHWGGAWRNKNSVNSERCVLKLQST